MNKCYSELIKLKTFDERYEYLRLKGIVGEQTFGYDRYLNQYLYNSSIWKSIRNQVIVRDNGYDLGVEGLEIEDMIIVHHINPITLEDIENDNPCLYDLENLISSSDKTHKGIHYDKKLAENKLPVERRKNDTCPWLK